MGASNEKGKKLKKLGLRGREEFKMENFFSLERRKEKNDKTFQRERYKKREDNEVVLINF